MKKLLIAGASLIAVISAIVGFSLVTQDTADAATGACDVTVLNNKAINISADGKTASVNIKTQGNCVERYATLSVWKLPNKQGLPLQDQEFFGYQTKKLVPGITTLSVNLPDCYWQVDLLGQKRPKSIYGDANYDAMGKDALVNFKLGGDKACDQPEEPKCPIPGMENLPANDPDCVEPETPETPETPVTPAAKVETPESLPNTGAGAFAAIASTVTGVGSGIAHYVIRRRKM